MNTDSPLGFVFKKVLPTVLALFQLAGCATYGPRKDNETPAAGDPVLVRHPFKNGKGAEGYVQATRTYPSTPNTLQPMETSIPADATVLVLRPTNPGEKAIFYRKNGTIKNPAKDCLNGKQCAKVSERLGVYERIEMEKLTAVEIQNASTVPQQSMVTQELSQNPEDNVIVMFLRFRGRDAWEEGRDSTPSRLPTLSTLNDPSITWSSELLPYVAKKYTDAAYMILSGTGQFVMGVGTGFGNVLKGIAAIKESERRTPLPDMDFQYTNNSPTSTAASSSKAKGGNAYSQGGDATNTTKVDQENVQKVDQKNVQKTDQENVQKVDQKVDQNVKQEQKQDQDQKQGQKQDQDQKQGQKQGQKQDQDQKQKNDKDDKNKGHGSCTKKDSKGNCQSDASDILFQQQMMATLLFGGIFDGKHVFIESQQRAETSTTAAQVAVRPANRGPVQYRSYPLPNKIPA